MKQEYIITVGNLLPLQTDVHNMRHKHMKQDHETKYSWYIPKAMLSLQTSVHDEWHKIRKTRP